MGRGGVSLHFVLGGARSGKSAFAEALVSASGLRPLYLATGRAFDAEMRARIAEHRERRPPPWETVEAPLRLAEALRREAHGDRAVLVDCLTLWLTNLMLEDHDVPAAFAALATALAAPLPGLVVIVSNEVGLSIVPDNRMARDFRDHAGRLHQRVAALAGEVTFVAAGLPLKLKG
ncbi:bifunctional adenosylcobinamide kinase/adenosylcobinamide-phosphate guanylyltransferase [Aureimonas flava]|uniref:Bifunctional adenosylcobalamin biosynthesis protein n=1 Tax=Aureimonas flava TaxID=2320271 RepID=A0A3A1WGG1_9HYPH|nr:bifunctional adenosylcobinamide kinase/adenosylcobinamide-phosphate guanylyltransferase [Aureimonas flava]RIX99266.1 bifunctional adenosylcobinamide kinase/adenosylcobinamide-phosphate guanylyltransferase [Aureimonas flava]